jgi:hypothetical protein
MKMNKEAVKAYLVTHKEEIVKKVLIGAGIIAAGAAAVFVANYYSSGLDAMPESEAEGIVPEIAPEA